MADFNLHAPEGATKKRRRVGRGQSSGLGTTAGRGNKGQQSRSGGKTYPGFEGGQMPLYRRLPHRGFTNTSFKKVWQIVNLEQLDAKYAAGEIVDGASLMQKRLVKKSEALIKILGEGSITKALTFQVDKVSASAKAKIEKAGGTVETPSGDVAASTGDAPAAGAR
jgi:large subunit ribosomal protein L15